MCLTAHMCGRACVQPNFPYLLQGFQNGASHFCSLKFTKLCMKQGLSSILARKLVKFARGVLNKYPTLWLTGARQPTRVSDPLWVD